MVFSHDDHQCATVTGPVFTSTQFFGKWLSLAEPIVSRGIISFLAWQGAVGFTLQSCADDLAILLTLCSQDQGLLTEPF